MREEFESGEVDPSKPREPMTDKEVADFAKAIYRNEIFTSWMIRKGDEGLLHMIFMPLIFLDEVQQKELVADKVAHFWAKMSEAGPRSVNGYPIFMSLGSLTQYDSERIIAKYNEIRELLGD